MSEREKAKFEKKTAPMIMPGEKVLWTGGTLKKSSMWERKAGLMRLFYIIPGVLFAIGAAVIIVSLLTDDTETAVIALLFFGIMGLLFCMGIRGSYAVAAYAVTDKRFIIVDKASSRSYDIGRIVNVRYLESKRNIGFIDFMIYERGQYTMRGVEAPKSVSELICRTAYEAGQAANNMQQGY